MFLSGSMQCAHCGVTKSPLWRNIPSEGTCCNACGLYFKNNNRRRPLELLGKPKAPTASTEGTPRTPKERDRSRKDANTKRADRHLDANTLLITPNFQNRTTRTAIGLQRSKPWVKPALPSRRESRKATHVRSTCVSIDNGIHDTSSFFVFTRFSGLSRVRQHTYKGSAIVSQIPLSI